MCVCRTSKSKDSKKQHVNSFATHATEFARIFLARGVTLVHTIRESRRCPSVKN